MRTEYATPENDTGEADSYPRGTIPRAKKGKIALEFWLTRPCPKGINRDDWDRLEQEKWDRIFPKEKNVKNSR